MENDNISQLIQARARQFGEKPALALHGDPSESFSYRQLDLSSGRLAVELMRLGVQADDRIAILSDSRPRWGVAFFAVIRAGGIVIPLDGNLSDSETISILETAKPRVLLVSKAQESVAAAYLVDHADVAVISIEKHGDARYPSMDTVGDEEMRPCVPRSTNDVALITYTSGTMGKVKGVMTTFGNLLFQVHAFRQVMHNDDHWRSVSILPLSHLFELTAGFLGLLYGGGSIRYCKSLIPSEISDAMREQRVTCMTTVPLFLNLLGAGIQKQIAKLSLMKRLSFRAMQKLSAGLPMSTRRKLFRSIHQNFGGDLECFVCGGAPLDERTLAFFESIGFEIYQGYGMAEASPVIATNGPDVDRRGSVGKPLPDIEVRISADGEILTRGPHVMRGYFENAEATRKAIDGGGWLHTGDIGCFDDDGFLYVSGRSKNVIVLGSGKNVQPEEVEPEIFSHPDIEEGCIVGTTATQGILQGSEEVCAIAVPSEEVIERCRQHSTDVLLTIRQAIEKQSKQLAPCRRPTRIILHNQPLPRTATRKIRRVDVQKWACNQEVMS